MKKYSVLVFALIFVLFLIGCDKHKEDTSSGTKDISDYITEKDGKHYLILPVSNTQVAVKDDYVHYLEYADIYLLKKADEKISGIISQYTDNSGFFLGVDSQGYLILCAETVERIYYSPDVYANETVPSGCGIDHEHRFFSERITAKAVR